MIEKHFKVQHRNINPQEQGKYSDAAIEGPDVNSFPTLPSFKKEGIGGGFYSKFSQTKMGAFRPRLSSASLLHGASSRSVPFHLPNLGPKTMNMLERSSQASRYSQGWGRCPSCKCWWHYLNINHLFSIRFNRDSRKIPEFGKETTLQNRYNIGL